CARGGGDLDVW
nr:immunoglobulin heavy chain junction region [Macaca mulatta]MOW18859.1 immunoglobulin heavy chain junction region [Macaca mulatta]MOW18861.1 immunoglobulin heavy chain junction region [Macaca mulatta]MOW18894.1 immunoglobulin heavy chain junction region [Macaca mulatta]MOW18921.1 immunoglobulin heavy chain junction region [Macaca mulatta]